MKLFPKLIRGANDAAQRIVRLVAHVANDIGATDPAADGLRWARLAKYGEYPATGTKPDGTRVPIVQVVDRESAEAMGKRLTWAVNNVADFFRGLPIYVGHPDDAAWAANNPGYKKIAVGRIKKIEARDDGPWMGFVLNDEGERMISGDAAPLSCQSPNWGMAEIPGKPGRGHVVQLFSVGLVERSNIPGNTIGVNDLAIEIETEESPQPEAGGNQQNEEEHTMLKPETLAALGLKPDATEDEINAAIMKVLAEKTTAATEVAAANERATKAETSAAGIRKAAVEAELTSAVNDGRITEAEKPAWQSALEADFEAEGKKLRAKMRAINTADHVTNGLRKGDAQMPSSGIVAINDAVSAYATEHKIDMKSVDGYARAFAGAKAAKPELFK